MARSVHLLRVPYDSGARGARMGAGPDRLAPAVADALAALGCTVAEHTIEAPGGFRAEIATGFALMRRLSERVAAARTAGALPLVLAGNCNSAVGTVSGIAAASPAGDRRRGVIWLDAHGDYETPETTTSGFLDGTGLATLTGRCWRALAASVPGFAPLPGDHAVLVGARDVSAAETTALAGDGVRWIHPAAIAERGAVALEPALAALQGGGVREVYLHVDLDVHDPAVAPANGYVVPGGLTPEAVRAAVRLVRERFDVAAAAFTAYDPAHDPAGRMPAVAAALARAIAAA